MIMLTILNISATALSAQQKSILFVMSAADTLELNQGKKLRQTGVFLNEFYLAYHAVTNAGYSVDFATPDGVVATIDNESLNDNYWKNNLTLKKEAIEFVEENSSYHHPLSLQEAFQQKEKYSGLVIPGGQGLMIDLIHDLYIPVLLKYFASEKKPTGLICHAPSLISTIPKDKNPYIGFKVNSVSPFEEFVIERFIMKGIPENRKIARQLRKMGIKYKQKLPKADFAVKDRNLVTSQNPYSSQSFNELYLEALTEYEGEQ